MQIVFKVPNQIVFNLDRSQVGSFVDSREWRWWVGSCWCCDPQGCRTGGGSRGDRALSSGCWSGRQGGAR